MAFSSLRVLISFVVFSMLKRGYLRMESAIEPITGLHANATTNHSLAVDLRLLTPDFSTEHLVSSDANDWSDRIQLGGYVECKQLVKSMQLPTNHLARSKNRILVMAQMM